MILGIDYGNANIGLAISEGEIAEPYGTVAVSSQQIVVSKIEDICKKLDINLIIVGVSEGKSKDLALKFGRNLSDMLRLPVTFVDETLTSIEADSGKRKDKNKIHERAAAVILQRYLDEKG